MKYGCKDISNFLPIDGMLLNNVGIDEIMECETLNTSMLNPDVIEMPKEFMNESEEMRKLNIEVAREIDKFERSTSIKSALIKSIASELQTQVLSLIEEVNFLRNELQQKNEIISYFVNKVRQFQKF